MEPMAHSNQTILKKINHLKNVIFQQMTITEGSAFYGSWIDTTSVPIYISFYFFNVSNAKEFLDGANSGTFIKPILTQHGPYVYR